MSFWNAHSGQDVQIKMLDTLKDELYKAFYIPKEKLRPRHFNYSRAYQVGERRHTKGPGYRHWDEIWYDPESGTYDHRMGSDFFFSAEFWQEVAMLAGPNVMAEGIAEYAEYLSDEELEAGRVHYNDLWIWDEPTPRNEALRDGFEIACEKRAAGTDKKSMFANKFDILKQIDNTSYLESIMQAA